jgi:drug/metabolite transporter (DMT)-like permease
MTLWGMRGVSFVVFVTLALVLRSRGGVVAKELPALLAIGCGDMGANLLFGLASSRGQVSVASVLGSLYPVVTILLARVILKEQLRRVQQVGAVLSLAGAAVIAL